MWDASVILDACCVFIYDMIVKGVCCCCCNNGGKYGCDVLMDDGNTSLGLDNDDDCCC